MLGTLRVICRVASIPLTAGALMTFALLFPNEVITVAERPTLRWLHARLGRSVAVPTFPSVFPVFALDRLWIQPRALVREVKAHATATARIASDHLPIVARIALPSPG